MKPTLLALLLVSFNASAMCPTPQYTGNQYIDNMAQQQFYQCLQQEQLQQQQLQAQQQQLQQQQYQPYQPQQPGQINWNVIKPLRF